MDHSSSHGTRCAAMRAFVVITLCSSAHAGGDIPRLIDVARPTSRPAGAPMYSDVCFSSRWLRPANDKDPHDSLKSIDAFRATRLDWAYIGDKEFIAKIKARGLAFCPTINSSAFVGDLRPMQKRGRILDLHGNVVTAPWMRMWKDSSWGCVNSPDYRESYLSRLKQYADMRADSIQTDDPGNNWTATRWGACFCEHCMHGFTRYLKRELRDDQRADLDINDIDAFNYADHLRRLDAPVGDAYANWNGGELKTHFIDFQQKSVEAFHRDLWAELDKHAGRHIPISANNGGGMWGFPYHLFDYGMGELSHHDAHPARIRENLLNTRKLGKAQVFTFVSTDVRQTRRVIAACYANGAHMIVPWDVYLKSTPEGSERYFGKPEEYADLYHFVRDNVRCFDDYEDAAVIGPELRDERYPNAPLRCDGTGNVAAFARARPARADAPIVIHLLNLADEPQSFKLIWQQQAFFNTRSIQAELREPAVTPQRLAVDSDSVEQSVRVENLKLWALLIVGPR